MPSTSSSSTNDPFAKATASTTSLSSSLSSSSAAVPAAVNEPLVTFHRLPARFPSSSSAESIYQSEPPAHHVTAANGTTVTGFRNPWPSFVDAAPKGPAQAIHARFLSRERRYVPVPSAKEELVQVVRPDWGWGCCGHAQSPPGSAMGEGGQGGGGGGDWGGGGGGGGGLGAAQKEMGISDEGKAAAAGKDGEGGNPNATKMKATWIGHASWLVETGVKRRAPIATPSITLTTDDAGDGKVTTTTLDLGGDSDSDDSDDDSSSISSSAGGPDDKTDHEKDDGKKNKKRPEKEGKKKKKKKKAPHVERGIRILCDPVFSSRMSPVRFAGPKRFTPPPCALADLPDPVDVVIISHDHYDHLDAPTIRFLVDRERKRQHAMKIGRGILFLCGLGVGRHLQGMGVREEEIVELDWWEGVRIAVRGVKGAARVIATPSQHFSGRGVWDAGKSLWCSWVVEEIGIDDDDDDKRQQANMQASPTKANESDAAGSPPPLRKNKRLYFAGDTGYRSVPPGVDKDPDAIAELPRCPAFAEIGELYGPFDLSLLPIGCYSPRILLSPVHAAPEDSVCMHKDLRSKKSVAMHYGTVRMPLSEQYEDVREPPRLWKECAEKEGLKWGEDVEVCKIGETVLV
ncbi:Uncharacterized protein DIS24_g1820 [Lasiodiplodia hormozganensis]|uniref:Metallo-beta-lactamase domain-containing protein n=1 Tax=Lasiodiplodia hormozganensis TaxID=869390 RepID=A0AA39Z3A5_9PEZI|nr:Uncharacterized protein DIS24_g1820 [Lasiodiplodia hormozganensis]